MKKRKGNLRWETEGKCFEQQDKSNRIHRRVAGHLYIEYQKRINSANSAYHYTHNP